MRFVLLMLALLAAPLSQAQEKPASPTLLTLGPIDGESDAKSSVITMRYDTKPGFTKPVVEAHGSFLQVILPHTMVLKPGVFVEANSPYIRKFAAFQLDEDTAALRMFVTKEAENIVGAATVDILENRVLVVIDHEKAEKALLANFSGVPVKGSPDKVVKATEVRTDIPDPIALMSKTQIEGPSIGPALPLQMPAAAAISSVAAASTSELTASKVDVAEVSKDKAKAAVAGTTEAAEPRWADTMESKLVAVTVFVALMLVLLIALKSWRRVAVKTLTPGADFSIKTLATHALGPKQRISVIQVGQEQILLGVSPDGINFLTSLKQQTADTPRMQLDPSMYQKTLSSNPKRPNREISGVEPLQKSRSPETRAEPRASEARLDRADAGSSIRYGVGDSGIKNFKESGSSSGRDQESLEDVTRMIRKKLKDLPKV
ncbi:MAG: flagellar biosynthetic protein FliO [Oligoflexus sp.]|nr:flagellar biosynthetic protein FliO [Oligoflexus sp.]